MAGVFRIGFGRLFAVNRANPLPANARLPELLFCRHISGKSKRLMEPEVKKPTPYPYRVKNYNLLHRLFDRTSARIDENSKLIVVDGPIAAGKSEFAKVLAEDLDMLYLPEANLDMFYINSYGFDLRSLNNKIPESCYLFDVHDFCANPNSHLATVFQLNMYGIRFSQYVDALAHILSTGQGVVLDRSVYSDFVFLEAMYNQKYISRLGRSGYYKFKDNTILELMRPHLVIYLDVPVPKVQENIKKRNIPYEVNSKVFTTEYLTHMERVYKQDYLKTISEHAELLVYDWSDGGDVEVIIEDIERIDFDRFGKYDKKMADWRLHEEDDWAMARNKYADNKEHVMTFFNVPCYEVPELILDPEDFKEALDIWQEAPGEKFEKGYNKGDEGVLFKWKIDRKDFLPIRERKIQC